MTGMRRSCAAVLEEMLWDHRLSVLTQASQRNWPWGQEIFGRGKLIVCKRGKTSTGVRKPCHPSSASNARTTHSELDFQRWGIPAISEENSRSSQKKQPCYPRPGGPQEGPATRSLKKEGGRQGGDILPAATSLLLLCYFSSPPVLLQQNKEGANSDSNIKKETPCSPKQESPSSKAGKKTLSQRQQVRTAKFVSLLAVWAGPETHIQQTVSHPACPIVF